MLMDNMVDVANTWILGGVLVSGQTTQLLLTKVFAMMDNFSIGKRRAQWQELNAQTPSVLGQVQVHPTVTVGQAHRQD